MFRDEPDALYHYRISRRKGRSGVAARNRKCQWEIAGAKHHNRTNRNQHAPKVRPWQRFALRQCGINPGIHERALFDQVRKHPQLVYRARAFAGKTVAP